MSSVPVIDTVLLAVTKTVGIYGTHTLIRRINRSPDACTADVQQSLRRVSTSCLFVLHSEHVGRARVGGWQRDY